MLERESISVVSFLYCVLLIIISFALVAPVVDNFLIPDPVVCLETARINFTVKGIPAPNATWSYLFPERMVIRTTDSLDSDGVTSIVASALEIRNVQRGDNSINICVKADNGISPSLQRCARLNVTCKENDCIPTLQRVRADPLVIKWTCVCEGSQTLKEISSFVIVVESPKDYRRFSVERSSLNTVSVICISIRHIIYR